MASPFPGMDPYLEQYWRDVHARFVIYTADQLQSELPGDLRALAVNPHAVPREFRTPYKACVRRGWKLDVFEYYRLPMRERLPAIRIPLRASDRDVALDLQALIDQCYRNGGYDGDIDYRVAPKPPLTAEDAL